MSKVLTLMKDTFNTLTVDETQVELKRIRRETLAAKLSHLGVPMSRDSTNDWFTWLDVSGSGYC